MPYLQYEITLSPYTASSGATSAAQPKRLPPHLRKNNLELRYLFHIPESERFSYIKQFTPQHAPVGNSIEFAGALPVDYSQRRLLILAHGESIVSHSDPTLDYFTLSDINVDHRGMLNRLVFFGLAAHRLRISADMAPHIMHGSWFHYETIDDQLTPIRNHKLSAEGTTQLASLEPSTESWLDWAPFKYLQQTAVIATLKLLVHESSEPAQSAPIGRNPLYNEESFETDILVITQGSSDLLTLLKNLKQINLLYNHIGILSCRNLPPHLTPNPLGFTLTPDVMHKRKISDQVFINQLHARRDGFQAMWNGMQSELNAINAELKSNEASLRIANNEPAFKKALIEKKVKLENDHERVLQRIAEIQNLLDGAERELAFYTRSPKV